MNINFYQVLFWSVIIIIGIIVGDFTYHVFFKDKEN